MTRIWSAVAAAALLAACSGGSAKVASETPENPSAQPGTGAAPGGGTVPGAPRAPPPGDTAGAPAPRQNTITRENSFPGATGWTLAHRSGQGEIEGYALRQSASPGEAVDVAVSVRPGGSSFTWILYRLGHYDGTGAREVVRGGPEIGVAQPTCPAQRSTGLVACAWTPSFTLRTETSWPTGLYLIRLVRQDGFDSWVPLVIRSASPTQVLMIAPTASWQAYNAYGGESLYQDAGKLTGSGRAFQVSFDRPYASDAGAAELLRWDHRVAGWLESRGEDVGYVTDEDLDRDPALAAAARVVIVSGHDEYWSPRVRAALDDALAGGTSILLFGANAGYWQIRYSSAPDGRDRRIITCYKEDAPRLDPVGASSPELTVQFRQPPVWRPENELFGVMFRSWNAFGFPLVIASPDHWVLAGTGLRPGDTVPVVGGYEVDGTFDNGFAPGGVEVVAEAPFIGIYGTVTTAQMAVRQQGSALVFAAGGVDFAGVLWGDDADPRVQRIAGNVLDRAMGREPPATTVAFQPIAPLGPHAPWVTTAAGMPLEPGDVDGPPGVARLREPIAVAPLPGGSLAVLEMATGTLRRVGPGGDVSTIAAPPLSRPLGLAADAAGNLYVADTGNACIRRLDRAGGASVLAGAPGVLGTADGAGGLARFLAPAGLAVAGNALYVADTGANAIRRIDLRDARATVTTVVTGLAQPTGVAVAADGVIYVVETGYRRVVAFSAGRLRGVVGGTVGFADGPVAQARILPQFGIVSLPDGSLVIADPGNYRVRIVRGNQVTTLAGSGRYGNAEGSGEVTDLVMPTGLAVDPAGRGVWIADTGSSTIRLAAVPP